MNKISTLLESPCECGIEPPGSISLIVRNGASAEASRK